MVDKDIKQIIGWAISGIIGLLLSGNMFFMSKMIDRMVANQDKQNDAIFTMRQELTVLKVTFENYTHQKLKGE